MLYPPHKYEQEVQKNICSITIALFYFNYVFQLLFDIFSSNKWVILFQKKKKESYDPGNKKGRG